MGKRRTGGEKIGGESNWDGFVCHSWYDMRIFLWIISFDALPDKKRRKRELGVSQSLFLLSWTDRVSLPSPPPILLIRPLFISTLDDRHNTCPPGLSPIVSSLTMSHLKSETIIQTITVLLFPSGNSLLVSSHVSSCLITWGCRLFFSQLLSFLTFSHHSILHPTSLTVYDTWSSCIPSSSRWCRRWWSMHQFIIHQILLEWHSISLRRCIWSSVGRGEVRMENRISWILIYETSLEWCSDEWRKESDKKWLHDEVEKVFYLMPHYDYQ